MASRGTRYSTEEERKRAKAESSRRYREKQRRSITQQLPANPEIESLESELTLITNRYRHQSDHLESLESRLTNLEVRFVKLDETTVTMNQLEGLREKIVAELLRLDTAIAQKRLPPSIHLRQQA